MGQHTLNKNKNFYTNIAKIYRNDFLLKEAFVDFQVRNNVHLIMDYTLRRPTDICNKWYVLIKVKNIGKEDATGVNLNILFFPLPWVVYFKTDALNVQSKKCKAIINADTISAGNIWFIKLAINPRKYTKIRLQLACNECISSSIKEILL